MAPRITVERKADLQMRRWTFYYDDRAHALVLDNYAALSRPSKRHGFKVIEAENYNRTMWRSSTMNESAVPMPDGVTTEALQQFRETLTVKTWAELKR